MAFTAGGHTSHEKHVRTTYMSQFAPDAIITGVIGITILLVGLIAVVRAGLGGALSEPVVQVLSYDHTAILGLIEIGAGLCLLLTASASSRSGEMLFGSLLAIAGFLGAVQSESFTETLALESAMGWIFAAAGLVIVIAVLFLPRFGTKSTTLTQGEG